MFAPSEITTLTNPTTTAPAAGTVDAGTLDSFIKWLDRKPDTVRNYAKALKQFYLWLVARMINRPTRDDLRAYRDHLTDTRAPGTVRAYMVPVRQFFKWTAAEGIYPNIFENIELPKAPKGHKKDYLTTDKQAAVYDHIDRETIKGRRDYAIIRLLIQTGMRTVEASRANIGDIREHNGKTVIYVHGKMRDDKAEYIEVEGKAKAALAEYLKDRDLTDKEAPLFTSTSNNGSGRRMSTRSFRGLIKDALKAAGMDDERLTAHSLRHTMINTAINAGVPITDVMQYARHRNVATTMIYVEEANRDRNQCAAAIEAALA